MIERIYNAQDNSVVEIELDAEKVAMVEFYNQQEKERLKTVAEREALRKTALSKLIDLGLTEEEIAALQTDGKLRK